MSDMRMDLIEHFVETERVSERAASKRADIALRIDSAEWRLAMRWLKRDFQREQKVLNLVRGALQRPLTDAEVALMKRAEAVVQRRAPNTP